MNVFLTGATGYVGHQLALKLAANDYCVHALVRDLASSNIPRHKNIKIFRGDITDRRSLRRAIQGCEQVFHTAAMVRLWTKNSAEFYKINVEGTRNVLDEALEQGANKALLTSSCGVLGPSIKTPVTEKDPRYTSFDNDYEFSKLLAENLVKDYYHKKGLFTVIVSPSKVFGRGIETHKMSVNRIVGNFIKGKIVFIPKPSHYLANYCFIDDVVEGHMLAMEKGKAGEKYILGGDNVSYAELFQVIRSVSGVKTPVIAVPMFFVKRAAELQFLQCMITGREPFYTAKGVRHIFCNKAYSSNKAMIELGYSPTPFRTAIQQSLSFFKNQ